MAVKTVTLSEDAYQALAYLKGEKESFSDVVRRLTRTHRPLAGFAGAWEGIPVSRIRDMERFWDAAERISEEKRVREQRRLRLRR
jgi:predicted CopG family antitoxin